jgi:hypothetical protein
VPDVCKFTYCEPCGRIQPPRSEHCTEGCEECIMRVDTHCKLVGNCCIGLLNQKFYLLYQLYFSFGCFLTSIPFWEQCLMTSMGFLDLIEFNWLGTLTFFMSGCLFFGIMCFFVLNIRMLFMNQTTYEFQRSAQLKPFKQNCWSKNIAIVFG